MAQPFDPQAHPMLVELGQRLRELAGDAAYKAGRDYLKKGLLKQGAVAGSIAYATVTGSTDYRVSVAFGTDDKVTCTCPAHRRSKHCKHVVALCTALLEQPALFMVTEPAPEVQAPPKKSTKKAVAKADQTAELRAEGLATVDRLLAELAAGGLMTLGADKMALLDSAGELVRSLKLRRLGNLVLALQRAAANPGGAALDPQHFSRLLLDIWLTRTAVGAHLTGSVALDPNLAEDLLGKTWRESDLEPVLNLELMEIAATREDDGEFRIETAYLLNLPTGEIFTEKQITPRALGDSAKGWYRQRLLVDEAGLYPGIAPRRIKLQRLRRGPLTLADAARALAHALPDLGTVRQRLAERLAMPFGPEEVPVLFRPAGLMAEGSLVGAVDQAGRFLALDWPEGWSTQALPLLPEPGRYALFGLAYADSLGPRLRCLSILGAGLQWSQGPIYPEQVLTLGR